MSCQRCWTKTLLQWALFSQAEHCNDHTCTIFSVSEQGIHCESEAKYKGSLQTATNSLASHQIPTTITWQTLYLRGSYSIHGNSVRKLPRSNFKCPQGGWEVNQCIASLIKKRGDKCQANSKRDLTETASFYSAAKSSSITGLHGHRRPQTSASGALLLTCINFSLSNSHCYFCPVTLLRFFFFF